MVQSTLYLFKNPELSGLRVGDFEFHAVSAFVRHDLLALGWFVREYGPVPTDDPIRDIQIAKGLLVGEFEDREAFNSLILQILLKELIELGRHDIVQAVEEAEKGFAYLNAVKEQVKGLYERDRPDESLVN